MRSLEDFEGWVDAACPSGRSGGVAGSSKELSQDEGAGGEQGRDEGERYQERDPGHDDDNGEHGHKNA